MSSQLDQENTGSYSIPKTRDDLRIIIEPGRRSFGDTLKEVWRYRELLFFLSWQDVSVRYSQAVLGILWVMIQPLVTTIIFTLVFNRLAKIPSDNIPYPIFVLAAIIPWQFFSSAVTRSGESLVGKSRLITKVYFPRIIIPSAAALSGIVDFLISLLILGGFMVYYKIIPGPGIFVLPLLLLLVSIFSISVGMIFAAANVRFRDVKFIMRFAVQMWMFATPIVYPLSLISPTYRALLLLNPMTGIIEAFRWSLLGSPFPTEPLLFSLAFTLGLFLVAQMYFRQAERTFADVV